MLKPALKVVEPINDDAPAVADPLAERAKLDAEFQRLGVFDQRLAEAESRLAEADATLARIDGDHRRAIEAWAATGAAGEAPTSPAAARRKALAQKLDLQAEADAARIVAESVAPRRMDLVKQISAIDAEIRAGRLSDAIGEARGVYADAVALAAQIGEKMMRLEALRLALQETRAELANRRDSSLTTAFGAGLSEVEAMRPPAVLADHEKIARFTAEWRDALR